MRISDESQRLAAEWVNSPERQKDMGLSVFSIALLIETVRQEERRRSRNCIDCGKIGGHGASESCPSRDESWG
jgi:hypothetical protein